MVNFLLNLSKEIDHLFLFNQLNSADIAIKVQQIEVNKLRLRHKFVIGTTFEYRLA